MICSPSNLQDRVAYSLVLCVMSCVLLFVCLFSFIFSQALSVYCRFMSLTVPLESVVPLLQVIHIFNLYKIFKFQKSKAELVLFFPRYIFFTFQHCITRYPFPCWRACNSFLWVNAVVTLWCILIIDFDIWTTVNNKCLNFSTNNGKVMVEIKERECLLFWFHLQNGK